jgi:putative glutamine amidotransferase
VTAPLIAIAGRIGGPGKVARTPVIFGGRRYFDAVLRAGGMPAMLTPQSITDTEAEGLLRRFDGLVLMGGADVDPALYGEDPHDTVYGVNRENDDFELALVKAAVAIELPTLAICRGMQITNVALGGTLAQHLGDHGVLDDHAPQGFPAPPEGVIHAVEIESGSKLAKAVGADRTHGASYHHQAVSQLGSGLQVTARYEDGTIEAVELDRGWYVCVQWHPEDTAETDPEQQALFNALIEQAAAR